MYRLYVQKKEGGWEGPTYNEDLEKLHKKLNKLSPIEYYSYLIIGNDGEGDYNVEGR